MPRLKHKKTRSRSVRTAKSVTRSRPPTSAASDTLQMKTPAGLITITTAKEHHTALRKDLTQFLKGKKPNLRRYPTPTGTPFQRKCWEACRTIPYGQTRTYAWLAEQAGSPRAVRAAGQAMRRNPMPVVVPCHRVVGAGGWIGGFAGDASPTGATVGLKKYLLGIEVKPNSRRPTA